MAKLTYSDVVKSFRKKTNSTDAAFTMRSWVRSLLQDLGMSDIPIDLGPVMLARQIKDIQVRSDLQYDGHIEPLGDKFDHGFRIVARSGLSSRRLRFTLAHEICHTYFYEIVPEVKYSPHPADQGEEWLCNIGAAELLVPFNAIRTEALVKCPCLSSLEDLAERYKVSLETILLSLTSLNLWRCQMVQWYRLSNGQFVLDRILGATFRHWKMWIADEMNTVWDEPGTRKGGSCYVSLVDTERCWGSDRIYYEMKRRADRLVMIWSPEPFTVNPFDAPLFMPPEADTATHGCRQSSRYQLAPEQPAFLFLGATSY